MFAKDFMDIQFHTLHPKLSITEAVSVFQKASETEGKKIFGMMVTDDEDRLVGMLSMYDILNYAQPKHVSILGEMADLDLDNAYRHRLKSIQKITVNDIMTTEVITIKPDTHLMIIAEIMIKKHIRRIPVVDGTSVVGIVYVSDVFYSLMHTFSSEPG
jgi:CBS domain-containing protein